MGKITVKATIKIRGEHQQIDIDEVDSSLLAIIEGYKEMNSLRYKLMSEDWESASISFQRHGN